MIENEDLINSIQKEDREKQRKTERGGTEGAERGRVSSVKERFEEDRKERIGLWKNSKQIENCRSKKFKRKD